MWQVVAVILWPSFLAAIVAEGIFFSLFDPHDFLPLAGLAPLAPYTLGFFLFWGFCALASGMTWWMLRPQTSSGAGRA